MRDHIQPMLFITLLTVLLAPDTATAQSGESMESWPDWVKEGMEKEIRELKPRQVEMPIASIRTKLPGKLEAPQAIDNGWYFLSDIEAGSPLECYIYTTALDLGSLTNLLVENNMAAVAEGAGGTVGVRNVHYTDAGVVAGHPYLALEWIYTVVAGEQVHIGFTKVRAAIKGDMAFACTHNYLGYRDTFARAFSGFVENTEYEVAAPAPYYEEVAQLDYNGFGAGVVYFSFTEDEEGDIKMFSSEASIMPVDSSTIMTTDGITISYTRPDGELINSRKVNVQNGEVVSNLSLQRNDAGAWVSGGTLQGKEISAELDAAVSPASELRLITTARDLFAGTETSTTLDIWVPSADPTRFLQTTLTRDDSEVKGRANVTLGPLSYVGTFDQYGNMEDAVMSIGSLTVNVERIWSQGVPTQ